MQDYMITRDSSDELQHYGIKGQKWGIRRYENEDGTLTEEGRARYRADAAEARKDLASTAKNLDTKIYPNQGKYMKSKLFSGHKYRKLEKHILKNTKRESKEFDDALRDADRLKENSKKPGLLLKGIRLKFADDAAENAKQAGKELSDAIASVSVQYINERFPEEQQARAKAWVQSQFVQGAENQIRVNFT